MDLAFQVSAKVAWCSFVREVVLLSSLLYADEMLKVLLARVEALCLVSLGCQVWVAAREAPAMPYRQPLWDPEAECGRPGWASEAGRQEGVIAPLDSLSMTMSAVC